MTEMRKVEGGKRRQAIYKVERQINTSGILEIKWGIKILVLK